MQDIASLAKKEVSLLSKGISKYHSSAFESYNLSGDVVFQKHSSKLHQIQTNGDPILIVPSLINKPHILDLYPTRSFINELHSLGANSFILDWGSPSAIEEEYNLENYINEILIPSIEYVYSKYGKVTLVGYCMGGFIATALATIRPDLIKKLATIATPWDSKYWSKLPKNFLSTCKTLPSVVPPSLIQHLFYLANPFEINRKYLRFNDGEFNNNEFVRIENWVNDGVPMSKKVFIECFEEIIGNNILMENKWLVNGSTISPSKLDMPIMSVVFKKDSIVPLPSALSFAEQCKNVNLLQIDSGHIGAIINPKYKLAENIYRWINNDDI